MNVRQAAGELQVSLHCALAAVTAIKEAHDISQKLEKHLRASVPHVGRVLIHVEPDE